ncbi:TRAP transporter small permease [Rhizobium sp. NTR19]|uniref:TRAP transporter small permease protein n=1 Tax=Neorhizobium turbinariae TaxID=2937795 RepID=A0ABT0IXY6_9HYPH|nr:TRAP transporter small permease [Neorhizobium turbinariae]MCK8782709.1 TRAP transporter small permease [Neorhizobium turbinariae]
MQQRQALVRYFLSIESLLTKSAVALATAGLALASLIGLYQIIARFVLHRSAEWSEPLVQMTLIWMTYLGLAAAMRSGTLISVDWLLTLSKGRARQVIQLVILLCVLALLGFILWFGIALGMRVKFQTIAGLGISASWAYAALPFGAAVSIFAVIAHVLDPRVEVDHQTQNT